jgi:hypothetical protein
MRTIIKHDSYAKLVDGAKESSYKILSNGSGRTPITPSENSEKTEDF